MSKIFKKEKYKEQPKVITLYLDESSLADMLEITLYYRLPPRGSQNQAVRIALANEARKIKESSTGSIGGEK